MADKRYLQAQEWRGNNRQLRQYSLRLKGLPPTFASNDPKVWVSLGEMIQRASTVPLLGVFATEACRGDRGRKSYAFIYVGNEEDGNVFIQDMANTKIDGVCLTAEWSSQSRPNMAPLAHRLQAAGGMGHQTVAGHGAPDPGQTTRDAEPTCAAQ